VIGEVGGELQLSYTVKEVLDRLDNKEKIEQIAEEAGKSASHFRRTLNRLGWEWDNSAKVWVWVTYGPQPLLWDMTEPMPPKPGPAQKPGRKIIKPKKEPKRPKLHFDESLLKQPPIEIKLNESKDELQGEVKGEQYEKPASYLDYSQGEFTHEETDELLGEVRGEFILTNEEVEKIRLMLAEWESGSFSRQVAVAAHQEPDDLKQRIVRERSDETTRKTAILWNKAGEALDKFCREENLTKQDVMSLAILDFIERYSK
jgi:hypothetical protein